MARKPKKVPGEDWSGQRVSYKPSPHADEEFGTVTRMATGKETCMFVLFEGTNTAKLCYARTLKKVGME